MNILNNLSRAISKSPIVWGILGSAAFFGLVYGGPLDTPFIKRYFTAHPVEFAETVMFAIGLSALVLRILDVVQQYATSRNSLLGAAPKAAQPVEQHCRSLLEQLNRLSQHRLEGYYPRRLRTAIQFVQRCGSSQGLDDELKYLADLDATRMHNGYALFRVIIWAIPILGFLGTVIGITMALNALDPKSLDESMMKVTTGLGVKFDTTALALAMSMLLMFLHFFVDRAENSLLESVDRQVEDDLFDHFPCVPAGPDGQVAAMRHMAEVMIGVADRLIQRQTELWQASMDTAAARWNGTAEAAGGQLTRAMAAALGESLKNHALQLATAEQSAAEQNRRHWDKLAQAQTQHVQALAAIQTGLVQQAEVLERAVKASGEVSKLQDALNRNLTALAGAKHFEQTVQGLAATIHLLNARLTEGSTAAPSIQLESTRRTTRAA